MRILNVIMSMDEKTGGGATERVRQLSLHLNKLGHDITILTTNHNISRHPTFLPEDIKLISLPCIIPRYYLPFPLFWKVSKAVKNSDIVHLINHWTIINIIAFIFIKLFNKPYIVSPLGALPIYGRSKSIKRLYNSLVGKNIINKANACVAATKNEYPSFRLLDVDESKLNHIPNGINEEDYLSKGNDLFRKRLGIGNNPYILFIGRLNPIKGPDLLLKAFCKIKRKFPDLNLVFIGPDEGMLTSLKSIVENNSLSDRVHFCGFVSRKDKSKIIHSSLFLTIPSRQEAMSIVVLEAGVSGKPVLITDQCGFDEVERIGGGLVVSANVEGLHKGINKMINQKSSFDHMGKKLQKSVRQNFLWSITAKKHLSLFKDLIKA